MTKLLYIPNGEYVSFWRKIESESSEEANITVNIEESFGWNEYEYTHPLEMLIYMFWEQCGGLRQRNKLPEDYDLEEFEIIYD